MAPPTPINFFSPDLCPPVTGLNQNLRPYANSFDQSGNFRPRTASVKRRRAEQGELDMVYDLSKEYPPLSFPNKPVVDLEKVKGLMVAAANESANIKDRFCTGDQDPSLKAFADAVLSLYALLEGVVENVVVPLSSAGKPFGPPGGGRAAPQQYRARKARRSCRLLWRGPTRS